MTRVTWLTVCAGAWLVVGASGCNGRPPLDRDGAAGTGTTGGAGGATRRQRRVASAAAAAGTGGSAAGGSGTGGSTGGTGGQCVPSVLTCTPAGGRYCGTIRHRLPGREAGVWRLPRKRHLQRRRLRGRSELHAAHV